MPPCWMVKGGKPRHNFWQAVNPRKSAKNGRASKLVEHDQPER